MDKEPLEKSFPGNYCDDEPSTERWQTNYGPPPTYDQGSYGMEPPTSQIDPSRNPAGPSYPAGFPQLEPRVIQLVQPGMYPQIMPQEEYVLVPDYFILSIVSIFFCTCLGIASTVKASQARTEKASGQYQTALASSRRAKNLAIAAIVVGMISTVLYVLLRVAIISGDNSRGY